MNFKEFKPSSWAVDNKVTVFVLTAIIIMMGVMAYNRLPKEQFPEVVMSQIYIRTIYPGTSPTDMENLVTRQIEKKLKSVTGVKKIKSTSLQDFSSIIVDFNSDVEPEIAKQRVSDAVDKSMADLPTDLDQDPTVQAVDFSEFPILTINVSGSLDLDEIKKYAEEIEDKVEVLTEITRVDMIGALEKEVQINIDIFKMQQAGINFNDISKAISNENVNLAGGNLDVGRLERTIRVIGEFESVTQIEDVIVKGSKGNSMYLRDFADIKLTHRDKDSYARLNRENVISLNVIKRAGENLISAADQIYKIIDELQKTKFPKELSVVLTNDLSTNTRTNINELLASLIMGFIFVVVVLMFFMGVKNAVFVGLAVPLSSALSFVIIPQLDFTFNIIVTFSFLLGLGIVVDNAIVMIENTHRLHFKEGMKLENAAKKAAGEVFLPVLAGTLTTIAPFFPLLFWPGMMGKFMYFMPAVLIIILTASLFVAFIINPVFAVQWMGEKKNVNKNKRFWTIIITAGIFALLFLGNGYSSQTIAIEAQTLAEQANQVFDPVNLDSAKTNIMFGNLLIWFVFVLMFNRYILTPYFINPFQKYFIPSMMRFYKSLASKLLKSWSILFVNIGIFLLFLGLIALFVIKQPKTEFFPQSDPNMVMVFVELPLGSRAEVTDSLTAIVEDKVFNILGNNNPLVKSISSNVGIGAGDPQNPDQSVKPHKGKVTISFVAFKDRNGKSTSDVMESIRDEIKGLSGTSMKVEKENNGPPAGKPINIEISGDNLELLSEISKRFKSLIINESHIKGIENLKSDLELEKPEIILNINREKANQEGISTGQIASAIRTALYGKEISKYREGEDDYDIQLRIKREQREDLTSLLNINLTFREQDGEFRQVPISAFCDISYENNYGSVNRIGLKRVVTLSSNVLEDYNENEINDQIRELAKTFELPEGYEIKLTGAQEDQKETQDFLGVAFVMSVFMVLFILVAMFNSTIKTGIILTTILFSVIGVFGGIILSGMDISIMMTMVGMIALAGIVVNNGILLIDFTDELKKRGEKTREAIVHGGSIRFTPVILTAGSTMLGLVPLATGMNIDFYGLLTEWSPNINFYGNDNTAFWSPLSWAIIYGLSFSTFITLLITPTYYYWQYVTILKYKFFRNRGHSIPKSLFYYFVKKLPVLS